MVRRLLAVAAVLLILAAGTVYWLLSGDAVRVALERQASSYFGQPVSIASARAQLFPRAGIKLGNVRVGEPARLSLDDVQVSAGLFALLSRRVEDAELVIADSRVELPLPIALPDRGSASDGQEDGFTVVSVRAITLRNVTLVGRDREIVVSADSSLVGSRLELSRFRAVSGKTSVEASGVVELEPRFDAKLEASANQLDLDDLLALAGAFTSQSPPSTPSSVKAFAGRLAATVTADRGTAAGVEFSGFAADVVAEGNRVSLPEVSFDVFGGRYEGTLDAEMGDALRLTTTARVNEIDVAQLAAFGGIEGAMSGRLSGGARLAGRGADVGTVLGAARGNGTIAISDGTIRGLELVRTVILFFGRPASDAPPSGGERFSRIDGAFSLERQVLTTDSLTLRSQDVDVVAEGTLAIQTKRLDGRANLLLSESLSSQAGTDLRRYARDGDRIVLPATIGGTLSSPRVMIDAAEALKRGLTNEMERRLKGLLDRFKPPPR